MSEQPHTTNPILDPTLYVVPPREALPGAELVDPLVAQHLGDSILTVMRSSGEIETGWQTVAFGKHPETGEIHAGVKKELYDADGKHTGTLKRGYTVKELLERNPVVSPDASIDTVPRSEILEMIVTDPELSATAKVTAVEPGNSEQVTTEVESLPVPSSVEQDVKESPAEIVTEMHAAAIDVLRQAQNALQDITNQNESLFTDNNTLNNLANDLRYQMDYIQRLKYDTHDPSSVESLVRAIYQVQGGISEYQSPYRRIQDAQVDKDYNFATAVNAFENSYSFFESQASKVETADGSTADAVAADQSKTILNDLEIGHETIARSRSTEADASQQHEPLPTDTELASLADELMYMARRLEHGGDRGQLERTYDTLRDKLEIIVGSSSNERANAEDSNNQSNRIISELRQKIEEYSQIEAAKHNTRVSA